MEMSYPNMYQNVTDGQFGCKANAKDVDMQVLEIPPGFYKSLDDILAAMQRVESTVNKSFTLKSEIDNVNHKLKLTLPNDHSGLNIISPELAHILGFPMSFLILGKGPHVSHYPIDILRVHSLMLYTDIIEYGIIGDTKAPLLRCFPFISRIRKNEIEQIHYMNYRSFEKLQFKKLMKNSFHSISINIRDTTGELIPFVAVGYTRLTLMFRKKI